MTARQASEVVCRTLEALGVRTVFGLPGTQTVGLFEALRRSAIRTVLTTHELGASFMANGYARASGRVGVLVTIPGPGFAYALPGLAEARADSAALLHITLRPAQAPGRQFQLQQIDQASIAGPLVKAVLDVDRPERIEDVVTEAHDLALAGEPGPVLLQIAAEVLAGTTEAAEGARRHEPATPDAAGMKRVGERLAAARRPVLLAGQGAAGAASGLRRLAERLGMPVLTTPSGRGVLPEDHPLALAFEPLRGDVGAVNALLESADLILAVGCKLTHNGSVGFALRLPPDRLVHVNTDREALGANYPASLAVVASAEALFAGLEAAIGPGQGVSPAWSEAEVAQWRRRLQVRGARDLPEPRLPGVPDGSAASFFGALRRALPRDGILVTDSGLHQVLARRYFDVLAPRGLVAPSDFQSMGFGVPAAVGARLAAPERAVVAVVGDGGFLMAGMELVSAVRERVPLTVVVFNDGALNQIRLQQYREFGHAHAVESGPLDLEAHAAAVGARYLRLAGDPEAVIREAIGSAMPALVEVEVGDSPAVRRVRAQAAAREAVRRALGERLTRRLKRLLGRRDT